MIKYQKMKLTLQKKFQKQEQAQAHKSFKQLAHLISLKIKRKLDLTKNLKFI